MVMHIDLVCLLRQRTRQHVRTDISRDRLRGRVPNQHTRLSIKHCNAFIEYAQRSRQHLCQNLRHNPSPCQSTRQRANPIDAPQRYMRLLSADTEVTSSLSLSKLRDRMKSGKRSGAGKGKSRKEPDRQKLRSRNRSFVVRLHDRRGAVTDRDRVNF